MSNEKSKKRQPATGIQNSEANSKPEQLTPVVKEKTPNDPLTGKHRRLLQNLPQVQISWDSDQGQPLLIHREEAVKIFRSMFTPNVWVQQHFFAMFTDDWNKLLCVRQISVGDAYNVLVDVELIVQIAIRVRATEVHFALTRPLGDINPSLQTDEFMQAFAESTRLFRFRLGWFFIMNKTEEEDAASEMKPWCMNEERELSRILL